MNHKHRIRSVALAAALVAVAGSASAYVHSNGGSTYMLLLWVIVFITARYLVSVLGKAQRRAAGAES